MGKQTHRTAIKIGGGYDLVTGLCQGQYCQCLSCLTRRHCQGSHPSFKGGHALFQHIGGWIHNACIDVAELAQSKKIGGVFCVVKGVRGGLIKGHGT